MGLLGIGYTSGTDNTLSIDVNTYNRVYGTNTRSTTTLTDIKNIISTINTTMGNLLTSVVGNGNSTSIYTYTSPTTKGNNSKDTF